MVLCRNRNRRLIKDIVEKSKIILDIIEDSPEPLEEKSKKETSKDKKNI